MSTFQQNISQFNVKSNLCIATYDLIILYVASYTYVYTVFIWIEAWVFISYKWLLTRRLYELLLHFKWAFISFRMLKPGVYLGPGIYESCFYSDKYGTYVATYIEWHTYSYICMLYMHSFLLTLLNYYIHSSYHLYLHKNLCTYVHSITFKFFNYLLRTCIIILWTHKRTYICTYHTQENFGVENFCQTI